MQNPSPLFQTLTVGELQLKNRIIMAPLTRCRGTGTEGRVPNELMAKYYQQRASAGLIITEATIVSPMGAGYPNTPGIYSEEQVDGWKLITQAVHNAGGLIFLQLWHVGRISDPFYLNGQTPIAPSAIAPKGHVSLLRPEKPYVVPRALGLSEIPDVVEAFRKGAENAQKAGFDGVEIHGANGYLLDQFLQDGTNKRTDVYGGAVENRARLMLEVTDAVISVWGAGRVGMHLAPRCDAHDMSDSHPLETFGYVAEQLGKRKIAFICTRAHLAEDHLGLYLKNKFGGVYIANENLTQESAEKIIQEKEADAAAFGRLFIANPDLPNRFAVKAPLNTPNPKNFYASGSEGYTDYSFL